MPLEAAAVDHIGVTSRLSSNMRTLHWVTKIGSLKHSLRFYELVLGLRVLRHEESPHAHAHPHAHPHPSRNRSPNPNPGPNPSQEFESGCEATCNGPYGGAWSKTMVGLGDENCNFVFELTYNYGIDGYKQGNDLQCIALAMPEAVPRAVALGYPVEYVQVGVRVKVRVRVRVRLGLALTLALAPALTLTLHRR